MASTNEYHFTTTIGRLLANKIVSITDEENIYNHTVSEPAHNFYPMTTTVEVELDRHIGLACCKKFVRRCRHWWIKTAGGV
jgi:hypothetical protein